MLSVASAECLTQLVQTQVYPGLFRRLVLDFLAAGDATISRYSLQRQLEGVTSNDTEPEIKVGKA